MFNTLDCTERFLCAWQVLLFMGIPWNSLSARARAQAMRETPIRRIAVSIRLTRF